MGRFLQSITGKERKTTDSSQIKFFVCLFSEKSVQRKEILREPSLAKRSVTAPLQYFNMLQASLVYKDKLTHAFGEMPWICRLGRLLKYTDKGKKTSWKSREQMADLLIIC